ncbi:ATP-dependent RNA helicase DDX24 [Episyrphus balteatus]|uniref:ATP-dependent RNA helicase DDX24 n=1 Tax=Episyrphus balteatus TaxID=286459 RepID=UPI00248647DB|nr:ATP-dependent RNA helicase DDX24 [Episyrphus balteatus]
MVGKSRNISSNLTDNQVWEKVKIKGNILSDDGGGFEGLIGLEVLENYDKALVGKEKKKRRISNKEKKQLKSKITVEKRKLTEHNLDTIENDDINTPPSKKSKKKNEKLNQKQIPGRFVLLNLPNSEDEGSDRGEESDMIGELNGWDGLGVPYPILKSLVERGFKSPTEIQARTLPAAILGKKDILGAAETGSGKTLAFGIPILAGIMELKAKNSRFGIRKPIKEVSKRENRKDRENLSPSREELSVYPILPQEEEDQITGNNKDNYKPLYAVVLTPTRELAVQVRDHLAAAAQYTGIKVDAVFGGLSIAKQERVLKSCPEIVVATPGRFWELLQQENPHLSKIDDISFLVIDETDRMVEKGHFEELKLLINRLNADEDKKQVRQNFIFSATLTLVHDLPDHLQKKNVGRKNKLVKSTPGLKIQKFIEDLGISQPKIVDVTTSGQTAHTLTECRLICPIDHKDYYLYYFIQRHPGRTIVFCNSIDCVKRLATLFGLLECKPLPLHASMIQKQRLKNLERFRDNVDGLLIATDVAARGLDIPNVEHVIHYQVPRTSENYVHRSGRTARANRDGITVMFMEPGEVKSYLKLCRTLDRSDDLPIFPVAERYLISVKERVNLAREVDKLELKIRRSQSEIGWMTKNANEMEIVLGDMDDDSNKSDDDDAFIIEKRRNRQHLQSVREQLKQLLGQQIFPKGFSYRYPTSTGKLEMPIMAETNVENNANSAVKVMKKAIDDLKVEKKLRNKKKKY